MPFSEPYRTFVQGDLFFGFSGARSRLVEFLSGKTDKDWTNNGLVVYIDQFLTRFGREKAPIMSESLVDFLRRDIKYRMVLKPGSDLEKDATDDNENNNLLWRRKSKGCLQWLTEHNHFVHFAIDEFLDSDEGMRKVVKKNNPVAPIKNWKELEEDLPWGAQLNYKLLKEDFTQIAKVRVITFAELRFAYRKRADEGFKKSIQFWWETKEGEFEAGPPPWHKYNEIWAGYIPSNQA